MSNTFGKNFRITTFGESHGECVGVVVDGCPAGLELSESDIQPDLTRRRPGQSKITTQRDEKDQVRIMSGVFEGKTTGAPIMLGVFNNDQNSADYDNLKDLVRPSHADFTLNSKYGHRDHRGGGRSSARIMIGRVAAGAIAKKYLFEKLGVEFLAFVDQVGTIRLENYDYSNIKTQDIEKNIIRCPDDKIANEMIECIDKVRDNQDSVGGCIRGIIRNCPVGLGEPEFDKLPALLAQAMMSINATKGFEIGSGFEGAKMKGSEHNDIIIDKNGKTSTNFAGGVLGGISNGNLIDFRVAIKPVATIGKPQTTITKSGESIEYEAKGRHDPCVLPRAVPIVEAMSALVIMDLVLRS
jgi:chorismate synthase